MDDGSLRIVQVPAPFRHLVSLVGRAFYGGPCPPPPRPEGEGGAVGRPASADGAGPASKRGGSDPPASASPPGKLSTARRVRRERERGRERRGAPSKPPTPLSIAPSHLSLSLSFLPPLQFDTRGLGIVLLDALARREWVREEDLADSLRISAGLARKALRFLEGERLVRREHRKEGKRHGAVPGTTGGPDGQGGVGDGGEGGEDGGDAPTTTTATTTTAPGAGAGGEEEGPAKPLIHSYAALDYPGLLDVVRLRRARLKAVLEERAKGASAVMEYLCPTVRREEGEGEGGMMRGGEMERGGMARPAPPPVFLFIIYARPHSLASPLSSSLLPSSNPVRRHIHHPASLHPV